eukprot:GHUV01048801.1.p1 GENE.GHUV01048801.1~~GHUV01048801.1.p1  ORF type:complete len:121 (+),score=13.48 GHUV01048801.1:66-428(+)
MCRTECTQIPCCDCRCGRCRNKNLGDAIDYGQQQYDCLGELCSDTLALFEQRGGEDAFINIKYMVGFLRMLLHGLQPLSYTSFSYRLMEGVQMFLVANQWATACSLQSRLRAFLICDIRF